MSYIIFWFPSDILHTHLHSLVLLVISQVITVMCFVLVFFSIPVKVWCSLSMWCL